MNRLSGAEVFMRGSLFSAHKEQKTSVLHQWSVMTTQVILSQPPRCIFLPSSVCGGSGTVVFSNAEDKNDSVDTGLRGSRLLAFTVCPA